MFFFCKQFYVHESSTIEKVIYILIFSCQSRTMDGGGNVGPVPHEDALQRWLIEWHKLPAGQEGPPILQALVAAPVQELESASQETFWQCSFGDCNQQDWNVRRHPLTFEAVCESCYFSNHLYRLEPAEDGEEAAPSH